MANYNLPKGKGASKGNKHAEKHYRVRNALIKAIKRRSGFDSGSGETDEFKYLITVCEAILDKAADGDVKAFDSIADRLDGKVKQIELTGVVAQVTHEQWLTMLEDE